MAQVYTPFTWKATSIIHSMVIRKGHLMRDASDIVPRKTVIVYFRGFEIEVDISFRSGSNYIVKMYLDPRGITVRKINKIRRWRKINRMMGLA